MADCGKRRYRERTWAEQALARLVGQIGYQPTIGTYWCGACHAWHVGHRRGIWAAFARLGRRA